MNGILRVHLYFKFVWEDRGLSPVLSEKKTAFSRGDHE